jgi:hypothetical protein
MMNQFGHQSVGFFNSESLLEAESTMTAVSCPPAQCRMAAPRLLSLHWEEGANSTTPYLLLLIGPIN